MSEKITAQPTDRRNILKRLVELIKPYRWYFWDSLELTLIMSVLGTLSPLLVQYAIDGPVSDRDLDLLVLVVLGLIGLILLEAIIQFANTIATNWMAQTLMDDLRRQVYNHILSLRMRYFDTNAIGQLQARTISDIETLNNVFSSGFVQILGQLLQLIVITGLLMWINWELALVVLSVSPLVVVATRVFQVRVREAFNRVRHYVGEQYAFVQEHLAGMRIVQLFNRQDEEMRRFEAQNNELLKAHLDTINYYSVYFPAIELITALGLAALVWYGTGLAVAGEVTFGEMVGFLLYVNRFFRPIRMIAERFNELQRGIVSGSRIFRVLDTQQFIEDTGDATVDNEIKDAAVSIRFEQAAFAYNPDEPVLKGISFEASPGTVTAVVGATGSGKSTLINVLMRFYDLQGGRICLNDHNIKDFTISGLRDAVNLVSQDVFLFAGSIYENATLNNPALSKADVRAAAKAIGADTFIEKLPGSYDYHVGERGSLLSSGQRQLIAFLRAMVYNPSVLLLDEATANIDTESEVLIQRAIDTVLNGRTSLIVAHRLSTIQRADQILVMRKGEIIERGNHQELLAQNGHYKKLYELQFASAQPAA